MIVSTKHSAERVDSIEVDMRAVCIYILIEDHSKMKVKRYYLNLGRDSSHFFRARYLVDLSR